MVRIAVVTGSSTSGIACIKKLLTSHPDVIVRGCFRTQERADDVKAMLVELSTTNYESVVGINASDKESLKQALDGVDRALLVTPLDYSAGMQHDSTKSINMIQVAKEMGVKRIVHVGSWTVNAPDRLPILSSRFKPTEEYLESEIGDDMEWTVLRGGYFMTNFAHVHLKSIREKNELLASPDCKIPPVDVRDIGEAGAALLTVPDDETFLYHKCFIECCGPSMYTHAEVASEIGAGLDRTITNPDPPSLDEWCSTAQNPVMLELYKYMTDESADGVPFAPEKFAEVLGRSPTSLRTWAAEHKETFTV